MKETVGNKTTKIYAATMTSIYWDLEWLDTRQECALKSLDSQDVTHKQERTVMEQKYIIPEYAKKNIQG